MFLNITKVFLVISILFFYSCTDDSTNAIDTNASATMTLSGDMTGNYSVSVTKLYKQNIPGGVGYSILGTFGTESEFMLSLNPSIEMATLHIKKSLNEDFRRDFFPNFKITRNTETLIEGTFSGEVYLGNNEIIVTNGKFYINKSKAELFE